MAPPADLLRIPSRAPYDLFYSIWLPLAARLSPGTAWLAGTGLATALLLLPWWGRPAPERRPPASVVDQERCTGCEQCWLDCPYDAIDMVQKADSIKGIVAQVTPERCVSCGICAGSCAPMFVGPPGRTGRDQLARAGVEARERGLRSSDVVVIACDKAAPLEGAFPPGVYIYPVSCAGSAHTSVVELFLRQGAGGVAIVACPRRDCWNREGPKWLEERLYHDREAELQARVDRGRVRLIHAGAGEARPARRAVDDFRAEILALAAQVGAEEADLVRVCREPVDEAVAP
jgi:coenzyme F420-reducing hydrogenase delta subunit/Pyruvate/2-oxoacid:ferredoxin oxidoreductase delta subunit